MSDRANILFLEALRELEDSLDRQIKLPIAKHTMAPKAPGVYMLYHKKELIYVGKASRTLYRRLSTHFRKISQAENIKPKDITFTSLSCNEHLCVGFESFLIEKHSPPWNSSGFGSNAWGSGRANQKIAEWDMQYGRIKPKRANNS